MPSHGAARASAGATNGREESVMDGMPMFLLMGSLFGGLLLYLVAMRWL